MGLWVLDLKKKTLKDMSSTLKDKFILRLKMEYCSSTWDPRKGVGNTMAATGRR